MNAAARNAMPTLSQVRGWESDHLIRASERWQAATDTWTKVVGDVAEGLADPAGTAWDGAASQAAGVRMSRDEAAVQAVAERLRLGMRVAQHGAAGITVGKQRVLQLIGLANSLGFDVREDLSVVDRVPLWPPGIADERVRQGLLMTVGIKERAAQLAAFDQQVATDLGTVTDGFDALDWTFVPILPRIDPTAVASFAQCWYEDFRQDLPRNVVQGALIGAATGALRGALTGLIAGPGGVLPGALSGALQGAATGALITGPLKTAIESAWDCL